MATETFYRRANVTRAEATAALFAKFPNAQLDSFVKKAANATEAKAARVKPGDPVYAATVTAEFPPSGGDSGGEGPSPSGDAAPPEEGGSDDSKEEGSDDSAPDFTKDEEGDSAEDGEQKKEKKLSPPEETNKLLQQLIDIVGGGGGGLGPDAGLGDPSLDAGGPLPDVGAPVPGAPEGGLGAGAPLPPPVPQKAPMGGNAFAHYDPKQAEIHAVRVESGSLKTKEILAQAEEVYPTHTVAKIQRTGKAKLNGKTYDLAKNGVAVITLVKK